MQGSRIIKISNAEESKIVQNEYVSIDVMVQMIYPISNYKTKGDFTNKEYYFQGHGAILPVDSRDADELIKRKRKDGGCCGVPTTYKQMFEIIGG